MTRYAYAKPSFKINKNDLFASKKIKQFLKAGISLYFTINLLKLQNYL